MLVSFFPHLHLPLSMTSYSPQSTDASDSVHKQVQPRYFQAEASRTLTVMPPNEARADIKCIDDSPNSIHSVQAGWQARLQSSSVIVGVLELASSLCADKSNRLRPPRQSKASFYSFLTTYRRNASAVTAQGAKPSLPSPTWHYSSVLAQLSAHSC